MKVGLRFASRPIQSSIRNLLQNLALETMLLTLKHQVLFGLCKKLSAAHRDVTFLWRLFFMHRLESLFQVVIHLLFDLVLGSWLLLTGFVEISEAGNVLGHCTGGTFPRNIILLCRVSSGRSLLEFWINHAYGIRACWTLH